MKYWLSQDRSKMLRASKIRIGPIRAQGVPAILLGSAAIVLAAGMTRALREGGHNWPETIRELRQLMESNRREAKKLTS